MSLPTVSAALPAATPAHLRVLTPSTSAYFCLNFHQSAHMMYFSYMDYTDDDCMNQFTAGQANRFKDQMEMYRGVSFE